MDDSGRKLEEVAKAAGVSPRTVRYYIQRGLLPQPRFRGPDTAYGEEHVVRLRAIRRLQEAFWPLDAIAGLFASKSEGELRAIADGTKVPAPSGASSDASVPSVPVSAALGAPPPQPSPASGRGGSVVRRVELADGVVLEVREPPTQEAQALVERIRALLDPPLPPTRTRNR